MKKLLALALSAVLALSLAACGGAPASTPASTPASGAASEGGAAATSDMRVDVFYYDFSDVYISTVRAAMDEQLKAMGIEPNNWDAAGSQPTQTDQVNTAITAGSDLLIVNIVETATSAPAQDIVNAAQTAGIPVIFFNREVADNEVINSYDKCAFVGTNAPDAGHMQGEMIGNYLLANYDTVDLNGDGQISYVMFKGQEGNMEADARTQYGVEDADAVLTAAGKPALVFYDEANTSKYLLDANGAWSAQQGQDLMQTLLSKYSEDSGNMVELVIANNDDMALGAISALQNAGYNKEGGKYIPVFGVDATDAAKEKIADGSMTGTIKQDAEGMANAVVVISQNLATGADKFTSIDEANVVGTWRVNIPYSAYTGE